MTDPDQPFYLSWHDQVTGPFTIDEIRQKLRQRRVNSLYKVQVGGEWILLRELMARMKRDSEEEEAHDPVPPPAPDLSSEQIPKAILIEEDDEPVLEGSGGRSRHSSELLVADEGDPSGRGLAISSFILSFGFFIPFLNFFTMVAAIIFGHLSHSREASGALKGRHALSWVGVFTSYIHGGFLVLALGYIVGFVLAGANSAVKITAFLGIHSMMFGNAVAACFGGGLLMLAVKMLAGYVPRFHVTFVATLLPISVGTLASIFVTSASYQNRQEMFVALGVANLIMLALQAVVWSVMVKDDDGEPLGFAYASVASLFYTIVSAAIGFLFILLFASLS